MSIRAHGLTTAFGHHRRYNCNRSAGPKPRALRSLSCRGQVVHALSSAAITRFTARSSRSLSVSSTARTVRCTIVGGSRLAERMGRMAQPLAVVALAAAAALAARSSGVPFFDRRGLRE